MTRILRRAALAAALLLTLAAWQCDRDDDDDDEGLCRDTVAHGEALCAPPQGGARG